MPALAPLPDVMLPVLLRLAPTLRWSPSRDFTHAFVGRGHGLEVSVARFEDTFVVLVRAGEPLIGSFYPTLDDRISHLFSSAQGWALSE